MYMGVPSSVCHLVPSPCCFDFNVQCPGSCRLRYVFDYYCYDIFRKLAGVKIGGGRRVVRNTTNHSDV